MFTPIFDKIVELVKGQIKAAKIKNRRRIKVLQTISQALIQVIFMVGGLGTNDYLKQYIAGKISTNIELKKPTHGYVVCIFLIIET